MNVQASEIRELTADEMNSVTGGWMNACVAMAYAAQAAQGPGPDPALVVSLQALYRVAAGF
jgi:hypothetical protein